jgi:uncharacterized protein
VLRIFVVTSSEEEPVKIRLKEIPQDGRSYDFDRKSGELDASLEDLVGQNEYEVNMFIKPIGNAYELRGHLKTAVTEVCSTCGYDFELPIQRKFHEILFEEQEDHRKSHSVHGNQSVDFLGEGPSMAPYRGDIFDAGEYAHEQIGLSQPFYPTCGAKGECLHIEEVNEIKRKLESEFEQAAAEKAVGHPAFTVLKDLNLQNKN